MKYRLIDEEKAHHPVSRLCRALGVTRAAYYASRSRPASRRALEDAHLKELIETVFEDSRRLYGAPKVHMALKLGHGVHTGQKRVARLMRELGLVGVSKREGRRRKAKLSPEAAAAPDLVHRRFRADSPNELWVADITYIETWEGYLFLACVMDMCTKRIVGWSMRDDIKAEIVVDALSMATTRQRPEPGLVHHSDRGAVPLTRAGSHASGLGDHAVDGLTRRCVRQRRSRELHVHDQDRARAQEHLQDEGSGQTRDLQLHRGLLQPA